MWHFVLALYWKFYVISVHVFALELWKAPMRGNFYNRNHNADMCVGLKKCKSFVYEKKE